ncbi:hypothetical protein JOQ06_025085, partial [Pogonophryne albipinna]
VPLSTVHRLVHQGVEDIAALRQSVIRLPAGPELEEVGQGFQQLADSPAFSSCVGAIDGCHIRIKTPPGPSGQDYINRKLFPSIQLQAVCDGKGQFLQTFVGFPGSVHDTRVLKNSTLYKEALYPPPGYFIVGDGGYPCIVHPITVVKPYREPLQGRVQSRFNGCHAKARSIIERAFWDTEGAMEVPPVEGLGGGLDTLFPLLIWILARHYSLTSSQRISQTHKKNNRRFTVLFLKQAH